MYSQNTSWSSSFVLEIICYSSLKGVTFFPRYSKLTLLADAWLSRVSVLFAASSEFTLNGNTAEIPLHGYTAAKLLCIVMLCASRGCRSASHQLASNFTGFTLVFIIFIFSPRNVSIGKVQFHERYLHFTFQN